MLCEKCKQKNATVYVNEYKDGQMTETYLCNDCAKIENPISDFAQSTFQNFLTGLLEMTLGATAQNVSSEQSEEKTIVCSNCKMTEDEFKKTGRFGCSTCYETFSDTLEGVLKKIQPNNQHIGKVPSHLSSIILLKRQLESLKKQLNEAIKKEEYEKAAKLRDQIRSLEKGGEHNE